MKKSLIIGTAVATAAAIYYFVKKSKTKKNRVVNQVPYQRPHHRTNVFADAKPATNGS